MFSYRIFSNNRIYGLCVGKLSPTNISNLCYNTKFTILTHQERLRVTVAGSKKIIMPRLQFSTQLYRTFPELDRLKMETLKLYCFCFQLTSVPLGNPVQDGL